MDLVCVLMRNPVSADSLSWQLDHLSELMEFPTLSLGSSRRRAHGSTSRQEWCWQLGVVEHWFCSG